MAPAAVTTAYLTILLHGAEGADCSQTAARGIVHDVLWPCLQIVQLSCGDAHTCALTEAGAIYTFGRNQNGQCGVGTDVDCLKPSLVSSLQVVHLTFGDSNGSCLQHLLRRQPCCCHLPINTAPLGTAQCERSVQRAGPSLPRAWCSRYVRLATQLHWHAHAGCIHEMQLHKDVTELAWACRASE